MADVERIVVVRVERGKYRWYRVIGSQDRQSSTLLLDSHLFAPDDLLELAAYVEEHRAQLEQEAQEDDARNWSAWSQDMADRQHIRQEGREYRER